MYKLIYYYIYTDFRKQETNDTPAYNALLALCLFQMINLSSLGAIINFIFKIDIDKNIAIYVGIGLGLLLLVINYFYIFRKKNEIVGKYEKNPIGKKRIYFWLYIIGTAVIFIFVVTVFVTPKS